MTTQETEKRIEALAARCEEALEQIREQQKAIEDILEESESENE